MRAVIRSQKKRSIEATSTVPPLLLATRNSVRSGSRRERGVGNGELVGRVEHEELRVAIRRAEHRRAAPPRTGCCRPCRAGRRRESAPPSPLRRAPPPGRGPARVARWTSSQPSRDSMDLASALSGAAPQTLMSRSQMRRTRWSCRRPSAARAPAGKWIVIGFGRLAPSSAPSVLTGKAAETSPPQSASKLFGQRSCSETLNRRAGPNLVEGKRP